MKIDTKKSLFIFLTREHFALVVRIGADHSKRAFPKIKVDRSEESAILKVAQTFLLGDKTPSHELRYLGSHENFLVVQCGEPYATIPGLGDDSDDAEWVVFPDLFEFISSRKEFLGANEAWHQLVLKKHPLPRNLTDVFVCGDDPQTANGMAHLVATGKKRAFSTSQWAFDDDDELPRVGEVSLITNWSGEPVCLIEVERVTLKPFQDVPADLAQKEAIGDLSLRAWQESRWEFFVTECEMMERKAQKSMPIVFEEFRVLHRFS